MSEDKVVFFDDSHTYWIGNRKLSSVGSFISSVFPKYDEQYWLTHSAIKSICEKEYMEHYRSFGKFKPDSMELFGPFLKNIDVDQYHEALVATKDKWGRKRNESAFNGSNFHDQMEKEVIEAKGKENPFTGQWFGHNHKEFEYDNESWNLDLSTLEDGVYTELLLFDLDLGIAGQADEVYIETVAGVRYADINDHKTNEKKPSKTAPSYCYDPISHLYNSKHNVYAIQVHLYGHLLKSHGFFPRNLAYTWYKKYDKNQATIVLLDDYFDDVDKIVAEKQHF